MSNTFRSSRGDDCCNNSKPFLILERICHTLEDQCCTWKDVSTHIKLNRNKRIKLWNERVDVLIDLVKAMRYLHGLK